MPANSLARRHAWPGELTAASDRIAPETYVRVHRVDAKGDPAKSVVVRITDHDVGHKDVVIDLDREAAEALGMVKAGQVRVRVETLALKNATTDKPVASKTEGTPIPKASEITDRPVGSSRRRAFVNPSWSSAFSKRANLTLGKVQCARRAVRVSSTRVGQRTPRRSAVPRVGTLSTSTSRPGRSGACEATINASAPGERSTHAAGATTWHR